MREAMLQQAVSGTVRRPEIEELTVRQQRKGFAVKAVKFYTSMVYIIRFMWAAWLSRGPLCSPQSQDGRRLFDQG